MILELVDTKAPMIQLHLLAAHVALCLCGPSKMGQTGELKQALLEIM